MSEMAAKRKLETNPETDIPPSKSKKVSNPDKIKKTEQKFKSRQKNVGKPLPKGKSNQKKVGKPLLKGKSNQKKVGKPLPKETAKSRKERKLIRKKQKPLYELSMKAKQIWEKLRIQKSRLSYNERVALVEELMSLVSENNKKLIELAYAHDTSRVLQTCLKQGSKEQREQIFNQLNDHIVDMCIRSGYAKSLVWKMLKYGTPEQRDVIMSAFKNEAYKLLRRSKSASVLEYAYNNYASALQRERIVRKLYGNMYQLCKKSDLDTLPQVLTSEPEKRVSILHSFKKALLPLVDKSSVSHTITHKAFYDFFQHCDDQTVREELVQAVRESLIHMMHTRDGAHVAMNCLWHGSAKDRKVILKSIKEHALKLCCEEFGHLVLLAAFDCVDDTVFLDKAIISPILKSLDDVLHDKYGRKVMLYLVSPRNPSHFLPETVSLLSRGDNNVASKKPMEQRHRELSATASPKIAKYVMAHLEKLVFDRSLFLIVEAAVLHCVGDAMPLIGALLDVINKDFKLGAKDEAGNFHIVEDPSGHLLIKRIVVAESKAKERNLESASTFSASLLDHVSCDRMASWSACNRGTQILLALVNSCDEAIATGSKAVLKENIATLKCNSSVKSTLVLLEKLKE